MLSAALLAVFTGSLALTAAPVAAPVPPPVGFFNQSWDQMHKAASFKADCSTVAGTLSRSAGLTTDEQHDADLVSQALPKLSLKETDSFALKNNKISAVREKSPALLPYAAYKGDKLQYNDAVLLTQQTPKFRIQFVVSPNALYYREKPSDKWKVIKSKQLAEAMIASISESKFTDSFDKASFSFDSWDAGKQKAATFKGRLTPAGADSVVNDMVSSAFTVTSAPNKVRLHIDSKTKNWDKLESLVTVDDGKVSYPLIRTCQLSYGNAAKVAIPASAKNMDPEAGAKEFLELANASQQ